MNAIYRIGLLGASRIAPGAVIAPVKADARFLVSAVAARDRARAAAYAREHDIAGIADDYASLITRDDVDVVYNALPPAAHAHWTIAALEAGKSVLCEKPFARNAAEARAMVDAAAANKRVLLEAAHYRFHRVLREAERLARSGALGVLLRGAAEFHVGIARTPDELRWRADQGGGAMMDLGFYPLHALRTLLGGEPQIVSATGEFDDGVDAAMRAELKFDGDVAAPIACSMTASTPAAWLRLQGDRGTLEIINFVAPQLGCRFTTTIDGRNVQQPTDGPSSYSAQLSHLHEVLSGQVAPLTGGEDAVANMRAIDAIYAMAR